MENEKVTKKTTKKSVEKVETEVAEAQPDTRTVEEEAPVAETVKAEEVVNEAIVCAEEDQTAECKKDPEEAECKEDPEEAECKKDDCAEVIVHEEHEEEHIVTTYDTETGIETRERIKVEESVTGPEASVVGEDGRKSEDDTPAVVEEEVIIPEHNETNVSEYTEQITQLMAEIETLKKEIAELKESMTKPVLAEQEEPAVNPFMADISVEEKKYRLLEEDRVTEYTLL